MDLSVCIEALYNGRDFVQSMKAVKELGISAIEFWVWWNRDMKSVYQAKNELGLKIAAFCTKFESLVDESCHEKFLSGLEESLEMAQYLDCPTLIAQVGSDTGQDRSLQRKALVKGLKASAEKLEKTNVTLAIEPLNIKINHKGYYLYAAQEAFDIIDEVGSERVKVLYDIYHQQVTEGDVTRAITDNMDKIAHFHCAGNPGRHELEPGEINYEYVFPHIRKAGYAGYIGLEYFPVEAPEKGIAYAMSIIQ